MNIPALPEIGLGADIGGGIASLAGGIIGAQGAAASGKAQAAALMENAYQAGIGAANSWQSLMLKDQAARYQENAIIGKQKALYGGAGVNPQSGSPLDVMGDTENQFKFEALNRLYTGEAQGQQANFQSNYDIQAAAAAKKASETSGLASIISGVGGALGDAAKALPMLALLS